MSRTLKGSGLLRFVIEVEEFLKLLHDRVPVRGPNLSAVLKAFHDEFIQEIGDAGVEAAGIIEVDFEGFFCPVSDLGQAQFHLASE
tara:strand:+ start:770 stop:1027 length:258 start_codon:yes stop_codon:yes gene_type:complete